MAKLDLELTAIETGANSRLIVQMPPRHGKSYLTSGYFPAHYLGIHPQRNVILTSASSDLANEFSIMARDLIAEHGGMFGVSLRNDRQSAERWELDQGGKFRAAGVGGAIMGRGADLLIIDDYFMNVEAALSETQRTKLYQWYLSTSGTRLSPRGAVVIMATRWHKSDLIGMVLKTAEQTGEKWKVVSLPAIGDDGAALWPEQWNAERMQAKRSEYYASGYPWMWEALYQQNPPDVLDAEWPSSYFDGIGFDDWPHESEQIWRAMALDPSLGRSEKADYSALVWGTLAKDGYVYVDAEIDRRDVVKQVDAGLAVCSKFHPHAWGIEATGFGSLEALCMERSKGFYPPLATIHQHANKVGRIKLALTSYLAQKKIRFKRNSPGIALLLEQLRGFPAHKHDDGPDALEMMLRIGQELHVQLA